MEFYMKKKSNLQKLINKYKSNNVYWKQYEEKIIDETREAILKDFKEAGVPDISLFVDIVRNVK